MLSRVGTSLWFPSCLDSSDRCDRSPLGCSSSGHLATPGGHTHWRSAPAQPQRSLTVLSLSAGIQWTPSPTACTGSAGGLAPIGQTLPRCQGWWRSNLKPPSRNRGCADSFGRHTPRRAPCTQSAGRRPQKGPCVSVVKPRRGTRMTQPTRTCTALTAASLAHQSLRLLRVCHFSFLGDPNHAHIPTDGADPNKSRSRHPPDVAHE